MTRFQKEQLILIAKFYPFSLESVENTYRSVGESFDKTVAALEHCHRKNQQPEGTVVEYKP